MLKKYDFKQWAKAAGVRAVKTMAQTAVGLIGTSLVMADVSWPVVASASVLAGVTSLLTSVAGLPELDDVEKQVIEMFEICISITCTVLSGLLLYFIKENIKLNKKQKKDQEEKKKNEDELLLGVARVLLIDKMQKALDRGYTTQSEYEVVDELYKPYIKSGGNGVVKHLFEDRYNNIKVKQAE